MCNHLIHYCLINYVFEPIAQTIIFHGNAIAVWEEFCQKFSKAFRVHISTLQSQINNLKQNPRSVLDYFIETKILGEELSSHIPISDSTRIRMHPCSRSIFSSFE